MVETYYSKNLGSLSFSSTLTLTTTTLCSLLNLLTYFYPLWIFFLSFFSSLSFVRQSTSLPASLSNSVL